MIRVPARMREERRSIRAWNRSNIDTCAGSSSGGLRDRLDPTSSPPAIRLYYGMKRRCSGTPRGGGWSIASKELNGTRSKTVLANEQVIDARLASGTRERSKPASGSSDHDFDDGFSTASAASTMARQGPMMQENWMARARECGSGSSGFTKGRKAFDKSGRTEGASDLPPFRLSLSKPSLLLRGLTNRPTHFRRSFEPYRRSADPLAWRRE